MIDRMERINELLRQEVSRLLEAEAETIGMVSVVAVDAARDLSKATVYVVNVLENTPPTFIDLLNKHSRAYREQLLKKLHLRRVPDLTFILDRQGDVVNRVEELIDILHDEKVR